MAVLLLTSFAGCLGDTTPDMAEDPVAPIDGLADGPLSWTRTEFELEARAVSGEGTVSPYLVIPEGSVHLPDGDGAFPVLVLMHGRHSTCRYADLVENLGVMCQDAAPVMEPVDSFTGYDYLAEHLAGHGYLVVSVSANHINDHDNDWGLAGTSSTATGRPRVVGDDYGATARARLILSLLDDLRAVQAGEGPEPLRFLKDHMDLDRIGLMGHSRGGEGVARAVTLNDGWPEPHALRAVFSLAPIDFDRQVVTGVPYGVLLPYCDGDVSNLQGAWIYDDNRYSDDAGPMHQFLTLGANHNYYNTVWTGSDWTNRGDPHCDLDDPDSGRDTPESQREHGLAVMAAFLRAYVGDETALRPYLTAEAPFDQSGVVVSYHPPAADRLVLYGGGGTTGSGLGPFQDILTCKGGGCPIVRTYSQAEQAYVSWTQDAAWRWNVGDADLSRFDRFSLRIAFDHEQDEAGSGLAIAAIHADGTTIEVPARGGVFHPPGGSGAKATLNMAFADFADLGPMGDVTAFEVRFPDSGAAQFTDVMLQALPQTG